MTTLATIETKADELNREILPELSVAAEIVVRDAESYQMGRGNVEVTDGVGKENQSVLGG
jgi:hypothetical protein